jgi:salicylate hydroxylase
LSKRPLSVAIVGGGIGGLTAALALTQCGVDVHVFEQSPTMGDVGAGIQLSANASRVLHRLGLEPLLSTRGVRPDAWHQRRWDSGDTLLRLPLAAAIEREFGAPHYHIHRADLLKGMADALPSERLHLDHRLKAIENHRSFVDLRFQNDRSFWFDAVIGADGIHSSVRQLTSRPEAPRFTGCVAYRGLVPAHRLEHLNLEISAQIWLGPKKHFVHYFVRSRQLVNFVAVVEQSAWQSESWNQRADVSDALLAFDGWHPQVRTILGAADQVFRWGLFDREPMETWSRDRLSLLGDACHPMLPFMAQGAAQAIEDGAALAASLHRCEPADVPQALQRYERSRLPRTSKVQALSSANKRRFHLPDGDAQRLRDATFASSSGEWSKQPVAWLYGHDAFALSR